MVLVHAPYAPSLAWKSRAPPKYKTGATAVFLSAWRGLLGHLLDPGADNYDHRQRQRILKSLRRRAKSLGYQLVTAEPSHATS